MSTYGSSNYDVNTEAQRVVNELLFGNEYAWGDRVLGDTIRSLWAGLKEDALCGGWVESEIGETETRYYISYIRSDWMST